jgi:hypothetical protein
MSDLSYSKKLKDPRWQKKRLEILERDRWACRECLDEEKTLHVHHLIYLSGFDPWEIPDGFLLTLCEDCHDQFKGFRDEDGNANSLLSDLSAFLDAFWKSGFHPGDLLHLGYEFFKMSEKNEGRNGRRVVGFSIKPKYLVKKCPG